MKTEHSSTILGQICWSYLKMSQGSGIFWDTVYKSQHTSSIRSHLNVLHKWCSLCSVGPTSS